MWQKRFVRPAALSRPPGRPEITPQEQSPRNPESQIPEFGLITGPSGAKVVQLLDDIDQSCPTTAEMIRMRNVNGSPLGLSTSQAAQALGVSLGTIRRWSDMGYLQSYRTPGGQRRFSQEQIDQFLSSLEQQNVDPLLGRNTG